MQNQLDSIKFCVNLINKLKNREQVDINNKLINVGIGSIANSQLKLLIQAESQNNDGVGVQHLQEIQRKTQIIAQEGQQSIEEAQINKMIQLKVKVLLLMKRMDSNNTNSTMAMTQQLIDLVRNTQDFRYILRLLFKIESLHALSTIDIKKVSASKLTVNQQQAFLYMIALVKTQTHPLEAEQILNSQLKGKYNRLQIQKEKAAVLVAIRLLIQKQKDLLNLKRPQVIGTKKNKGAVFQKTKQQIKDKLKLQYDIDLDLPLTQIQSKIGGLDEKSYLLVSPLFKFYRETNPNIIRNIFQTQLHRIITKITIIPKRPIPNPQKYSDHLTQNARRCENYSKECIQGDYFVKHNYNNLSSSLKYVVLTKEGLMWAKNKKQINQDPTTIKPKNIFGILYGKISARFQHYPEEGSCFSIVIKDRTLDLSIAKENEDLDLKRYVLGATSLINSYHATQKERLLQQQNGISQRGRREELKQKQAFHQFKIQTVTEGKLLWRDLFTSLAKKSKKYEKEMFDKAKILIHFGSQSPNNNNLSLLPQAKKKIVT